MARRKKTMAPEAFEAIARRFRVLSDPLRLRLLYTIGSKELTVGDLVTATGGTQSNVSKHLSTLLAAGLVRRRREGTSAFYTIADPSIFDMCAHVCGGIESDLDERRKAFR